MSPPLASRHAGTQAGAVEAGDGVVEAGGSGVESAGDRTAPPSGGAAGRGIPPGDQVDDRWVRAVGIPLFGLGIPRLTGLLDGVAPDRPTYWLGSLVFLALAAAIWHGNRWLVFEQR